MNATERFAQKLRCTSVDDARGTIRLLKPDAESLAAVKLAAEQCEYQGFQKTKAKMLRGWLKRALKIQQRGSL